MANQIQESRQNHKAPTDQLLLKTAADIGPTTLPSKKTDGSMSFLRAARSGNLEKVLEFINANVDINTSNSNGLNALHLASKDGHTEVVAELLKRGANVDAATKKGNTALHIASLAGQEEVVKLLIEHGASVNVQSQSGFTPLYMAAQENHERVVRFLLNHGANQTLATEDGFTPLAVAMQQGHEKVVTELLEHDTRGKIRLPALHIAAKKDDCKAAALLLQSDHNADITSKSGFTPLHIASHYGNDAIASLLLAKGADVNYAAKHNITPLHVAAKWGRNNMVILLLDKGASIEAKTRDGLTPLHCAARSGHEQVVDTLLQRHAPITAKTKNGLAPLHMASQGDHVEAARVLLLHRAPVDDVTVDYLTALHVASHCGHVSVAKLLLDRKADANARALNGFTPLHIACKKNRVKIVELLLKHGAYLEATTESGLSPLHVASFMGCMNIVIYLLQCTANPDVSTVRGETPLHLASRANQTDIIRILLRNGAQVDAKAREQQTPLHIAARLGNTDIVMLLLQHGANVDSATKDSYTSLHIASKEDQEEVAQVLLENNASMTATTKKGLTPLHLAAKYGRTKIATLLLQKGAPVDAQGKNGVTPLHVASHYDHQGIALLLLDKGASPHAVAKNGHTPLHIAAKKNQMDMAAMLLEYDANPGVESKAGFTPLHLSAQEGHVDMSNLLLEHGAEINHASKNGLTPLHLCAQEDCIEVAKVLVKNGADVNSVTKAGYTPLHIASHFGQLNMVRFLLSHEVKVDPVTSTGYTPLHQAAQQGNSAIVAVLLDKGASPDTKNNQGQTALCIAQKLGYISVVEVLKSVTEVEKGQPASAAADEKYKVVAPETMQENFMSDSEDEGGDDATNEQSYRYLTIDEMKSLGDDSLPLDVTKEDRYDTTAGVEESVSPQHTYHQLSAAPPTIDNVEVARTPLVQTGFLVSFLVDAKGGAMRGCRHSGVRVIVPPQCVTMPTRVTCRYVRRDKPNHPPPPPLMESEALASRILELGPVGVKFLGPVVIEVPNFAALRGNEREIVILRSDNGETWREHTVDSSPEAVQEILSRSFDKDGNQIQPDEPGRITSIVTSDFPHYFAIVSRIRQEVHAIGPEGGMVSSSVVPQVQAVFPQGALTKKIKVGLQAQPIPSELTAAILGNGVAVSPIVTIEPRRRKFHKPITLTLPVPQAANKGMINQYSGDAPTLRLLCSITGGTSRAQWEDVTGSTPLTFVKECVSFTTTVSARFWLMDIRDIVMATKKATELYREAIHIPFMAKFVVFAKRIDNNEARLRVFCMTDDKEDKTLECQEHFTEVAKSRDVEVLEGKKQLIELSGNLISVTKSGDQLELGFSAFQENRLPFTVRIKDNLADPIGRMLFFKEQKPVQTSKPHPPVCVLNIVLPDGIVPDHEFMNSPMHKYSFLNDSQGYHRSELRFSDISNFIGEDWIALSEKLGISSEEVEIIRNEYPDSVAKQALTMLRIWHQQTGSKASANILETALLGIGREDIVQECIINQNELSSTHKSRENGLMSEIIEDYRVGKFDISSTDDDERKYTAEEKAVNDVETKKSVFERKAEIEKRLQNEPPRKSKERGSDGAVEKRQNSFEQKDVVKTVKYDDEKEQFEPTSLTFQQKRLSFEKGLSVDKLVTDGDAFLRNERDAAASSSTTVVDERVIVDGDSKPEETMSFAEKRKSFELVSGSGSKVAKSMSEEEKKTNDGKMIENVVAKTADRRDSRQFEGDAAILKNLDSQIVVEEQNVLSSKLDAATPPSSPADLKGSSNIRRRDSNDVEKPNKTPSKIPVSESKKKPTEVPTDSAESTLADNLWRQRLKLVLNSVGREPTTKLVGGSEMLTAYKRCISVEDSSSTGGGLSSSSACGSMRTVGSKWSSFGGSYPYSICRRDYDEVEEDDDDDVKLNSASFKKNFAASCLPSSVWNQSLPNLCSSRSSSLSFWPTAAATATTTTPTWYKLTDGATMYEVTSLPHASSVEYFTPERNFVPKYGAYCTWSSNEDESLTEEELSDASPVARLIGRTSNDTAVAATAHVSSPICREQVVEMIEPPRPPDDCIKSGAICEIAYDVVYDDDDDDDARNEVVEPMRIEYDDGTAPDRPLLPDDDRLIDLLIERENAKLLASGVLDFTDDESDSNNETVPEATIAKQNTYDMIEEDCVIVEKSSQYEPFRRESAERSPQRKVVAFRLNSSEDELVYPGQTDSSDECTSNGGSDNSDEVGERPARGGGDGGGGGKKQEYDVVIAEEKTLTVAPQTTERKPSPDVERKFERMVSETEEECGKTAEGEFRRIVSQLSHEEVADCLDAWNETTVVAFSGDRNPTVIVEGYATRRGSEYTEIDARLTSCPSSTTTTPTTTVASICEKSRVVTTTAADNRTSSADDVDYASKKKFWQSVESASVDSKTSPTTPIPKPRVSAAKSETPPTVSRRSSSSENVPKPNVTKSESEDNVLVNLAESRVRPTVKQMHSLTAFSTDSEAEYIASCGIEKLAYDNVAFCEEDEDQRRPETAGNVQAKKSFFEKRSSKEITQSDEESSSLGDQSRSSLKKHKETSSDDAEDASTQVTNGCSVAGSVDSVTQSESDITPEELQDKQAPLPDFECRSLESKTGAPKSADTMAMKVKDRVSSFEKELQEDKKAAEILTVKVKKESETKTDSSELKGRKESVPSKIVKTEVSVEQVVGKLPKPIEKETISSSFESSRKESQDLTSSSKSDVDHQKTAVTNTAKVEKTIEKKSSLSKLEDDKEPVSSKIVKTEVSVEQVVDKSPKPIEKESSFDSSRKLSQDLTSSSKSGVEQPKTAVTNTAKVEKKIEKKPSLSKLEDEKEPVSSKIVKTEVSVEQVVDKSQKPIEKETISSSFESSRKVSQDLTSSSKSDVEEPKTAVTNTVKVEKIIEKKPSLSKLEDEKESVSSKILKTKVSVEQVVEKSQKSIDKAISSSFDSSRNVSQDLTSSPMSSFEQSTSAEILTAVTGKEIEKEPSLSKLVGNKEPVSSKMVKTEVSVEQVIDKSRKSIDEVISSSFESSRKASQDLTSSSKSSGVEPQKTAVSNTAEVEKEIEKKPTLSKLEDVKEPVTSKIVKTEVSVERLLGKSQKSIDEVISSSFDSSRNASQDLTLSPMSSFEQPTSAEIHTAEADKVTEKKPSLSESADNKEPASGRIVKTEVSVEQVIDKSQKSIDEVMSSSFDSSRNASLDLTSSPMSSFEIPNSAEILAAKAETKIEKKSSLSEVVDKKEPVPSKIVETEVSVEQVADKSQKPIEKGTTASSFESSRNAPQNLTSSSIASDEQQKFAEAHTVKVKSEVEKQTDSSKLVDDKEPVSSKIVKTQVSIEQVVDKSQKSMDEEMISSSYDSSRNVSQDLTSSPISSLEQRVSICEDEAKIVAENLINEIEVELNRRPDIIENLVLAHQSDMLHSRGSVGSCNDSNEITDEELRSTGTEVDVIDIPNQGEIKLSRASPNECEINFEKVEEFDVLKSVDFEEKLVSQNVESLELGNKDSARPVGLEMKLEPVPSKPPPIPEIKKPSSDETSVFSPEDQGSSSGQGSSGSLKNKKHAEGDPYSSSSESHYHSFATSSSRPCSSDVEGMLSAVAAGTHGSTIGSSEYDTAASRDTSVYSHEFHTAVSSASIHESLRSIDSESSGHLGSAEGSSEVSETLVASCADLDHDIDIAGPSFSIGGAYYENSRHRGMYRDEVQEPYDNDIPLNVIKGATVGSEQAAGPCASSAALISSCEDDVSTLSTGATVIDIGSLESDRMDMSLTSERSLTMSAISSDSKEDKKEPRQTSDAGAAVEPAREKRETTAKVDISPDLESFEFVEKSDLLDNFVVVEPREDTKPIEIVGAEKRKSSRIPVRASKGETEPASKVTCTLTSVKYYDGGTLKDAEKTSDEGSNNGSPPQLDEMYEQEIEEGKKWIEMQFQADSDDANAYEYSYDRCPLEDIKEEDTDEMHSSKVGSAGSQISQSVSSVGSVKQSLSSTPDYDVLAGKRYFAKVAEPDTVSQASLQEFERLEQLMALETARSKLSGSQDSLGSVGSGGSGAAPEKRRSTGGDDISVSSLKEFEGLEYACVEAERIQERAKAEERSLSQIEEGHESQASESESCETLEKSCYSSDDDDNVEYENKLFEIDEIIKQAQSNVEKFAEEELEKTESFGRADSFEENAHVPELEPDQPNAQSFSELYSGKRYIESLDLLSHSRTASTDSLEVKRSAAATVTSSDSLEKAAHRPESPGSEDEFALPPHDEPHVQISSPESGEATSSVTTHATYQNEFDATMSSSFTSAGSNTMVSSSEENVENIITNYSNWLEGGGQQLYTATMTTTTTEVVETEKESVSTRCTVRTVPSGAKTTTSVAGAADAKRSLEKELSAFGPGEFVTETREVDADGNVTIKRLTETRTVVEAGVHEAKEIIKLGSAGGGGGTSMSIERAGTRTFGNTDTDAEADSKKGDISKHET